MRAFNIKREDRGMRVGLFGGTFNPIHLGHLRGAEEIRETFDLEKVIFIPAAIPPHKGMGGMMDASHRLEMVRLAVSTNPYFSVSDIELERSGKSYSIDTIRHFRKIHQGPLFFVLGRDAFLEIETWKEFKTLFSLCHFIVMARPGSQEKGHGSALPGGLTPYFKYHPAAEAWVHASGNNLSLKEITFLDISSTKVRLLMERGESIRYLIPPEVETYIQKKGLYRRRP
jgi:nicotinate-nucleotide adenylyltransferase